jgi:NADH-quinone oxidoreductase subunit G
VRFTREVSKSHGLGVQDRGDHSLIRPSGDGSFDHDAYSDNVIDICPVGALQSKAFLHKVRVWYLEPTPSVCPGCERGCNIDIWHRKRSWALKSLDPKHNARIDRVTPHFNAAVNGPWVCNKARDLAQILERPRATNAMLYGKPAAAADAARHARSLIAAARRPAALVSNWASNEELAAFESAFGRHFDCKFKRDQQPAAGEPLQDELLIRADKNPNSAGARAVFAEWNGSFAEGTDLLLVWGEGFDIGQLPPKAKLILLDAYESALNDRADVFLPISLMTERAGHYTNFEGTVSAFEPCFDKPPGVADAQALFAALAPVEMVEARP